MITILTWLWKQPNARIEYTTAHVNAWAKAIRCNVTVPHRIACVTDIHTGLSPDITVIPPPREFENITSKHWAEKQGLPQCYRRIAMFSPHAASVFGERFLCMDIDTLIVGNLDHILKREEDFLIFRGTAATRPYNGGLVLMTAGARSRVYTEFNQEAANVASKTYLGSDQAWISHILGRGEKTLGEAEGVTNYCQRFIRENSTTGEFIPPADLCLLFFPGNVKAFHSTDKIWKGTPADKIIIDKIKGPRMPRFYAYDDPKGWGRIMKHQHGFTLINDVSPIRPGDNVFVRLDQQGEQLAISKDFHAGAVARGANVFPSEQDAAWYDNKIIQHDYLYWWMPETRIIRDFSTAFSILSAMKYPFISKASSGAGSSNVRLIEDATQAEAEIRQAFSTGIPLKYGRIQQGYVYWQKLVPGCSQDYRIVITGGFVHGLVRQNKPGTVFASGSGINYPMLFNDALERRAAALAIEAAGVTGTRWCAFDIVFDAQGEGYILEVSAAWTVQSYANCQLFDAATLEPIDANGGDIFAIANGMMRNIPPTFERIVKYQVLRSGTTYGKRGDIVSIPARDVQTLLRHGVIKQIDSSQGVA